MKIQLSSGQEATIDDEDYPLVSGYRWFAAERTNTWYAYATVRVDGRKTTLLMHRLIANPGAGMCVDHVNRNGLDCRKDNLRVCTQQQNSCNRAKVRGASKYKGVTWYARLRRWRASIICKGRYISLGTYRHQEEAALAYDAAVREHFGAFGVCNYPDES